MNNYRMADNFSLPVKLEEAFDEFYVKPGDRLDLFDDQALAAVHAINNYDAMQDRIEALEQERDQLAAVIFDIKQHAYRRIGCSGFSQSVSPELMLEWTEKSPAACLADIQAKAIEEFTAEIEELQRLNNAHDGPIEVHDAIAALICKAISEQGDSNE